MALLSPMLLFVLLLMSAAETQRKETNVERAIPSKNGDVGIGPSNDVATGPANDVATGPANSDVVGTGPTKNDVVGTGPTKNDVFGTGPAKNDVVGTAPSKNYVVGTRAAKNDVLAFSAELSIETELSPGSTIRFDRTLTNVGNMYYNTSGQFGCIDDALYVFVWNLMKPVHSSDLGAVRCIGSLHRGGVDKKYGPKTSIYSTTSYTSGVSEMMSIQECSSSTPTAVTITVQPWTTEPGSVSVFYPHTTSFSGFRLTSNIAFTAELSQDLNAYPGARIVFDKVLANHGNYYEDIHSYFRCPDAGVYVFSVSIQTSDLLSGNVWSVARLMMEKEVVMQGPITYRVYSSYDSGSSSSTTVLQCTPGLSVYVEAQSSYTFPSNSYGAYLTSFTGFKLYDVTTETVAFTAVMSQNFTSTSFAPVPFDEVITNIGNAFDTTAGHFVCPDDAYYLFTWTAVNDYWYAYMDLYMDVSLVKELHTSYQGNATSSGTSGSCTQSVILQCQPGSKLQLRGKHSDSGSAFLGGYTSFSGYQIPG